MNVPSTLISYRYDALDRLIGFNLPDDPPVSRFYRDGYVAAQIQGNRHDSILRDKAQVFGYSTAFDGDLETTLLGTDQNASVLQAHNGGARRDFAYTAHGQSSADGGLASLLGFNAEQADPVTGCYLLGNGYRAYNPSLMRFHSPDSFSPFGAGGINPYAYCLGDPVNRSDPTGHFSWKAILGIAIAVASIAITIITLGVSTPVTGPAAAGGVSLSTAAAVIDIAANVVGIAATITEEVAPDSSAGSILGYVSMGLGVASFGTKQLASTAAGARLGSKQVATGLVRQNATRSAASAARVFAQSAGAAAGMRNTVAIAERLQKANDLLNYADYSLTAYESINDYAIPFLSPPPSSPDQSGNSTMARQDEGQGLLAVGQRDPSEFADEATGQSQVIRQS